MTTLDILRDYFAKENEKARDLEPDTSLLERGLLDSMALVKLVAFLEERFGVELSDDEFDPDHFETLSAIEELVEQKRSAKGA